MADWSHYNPSSFIQAEQAAGSSAAAALEKFRDAASTAPNTQTWYRLWGQVANSTQLTAELAAYPEGAVIPGELHAIRSQGTPGLYGYQGNVQIERSIYAADGTVTKIVTSEAWTYNSAEPMSRYDAAQQLQQSAMEHLDDPGYPFRVLGATLDTAYVYAGLPE